MKYVITGSLGHISRPLTEKLIAAGHQVTVISSNTDRKNEIEQLGAVAAIGSVQDTAFLTSVFSGADAVYTMVPPTYAASDWKAHIASVGKNYAEAIRAAGVKNVVNLSSVGAHMPEGCGPVSGLYRVEQTMNALEGVNVLHLRPVFFYYNLLGNIGMIKNMGIIGGNYGEDAMMAFVSPADIAEVAADELQKLNFTGKSVQYILSDMRNVNEVASVLGNAIGKPDLKWVNFRDEDTLGGMLQAGVPEEVAKNYVEMGAAARSGEMSADLMKNGSYRKGSVSLEMFAKDFAAAFSAN